MLHVMFQAQQEVPEWLEEAAQNSYGAGFGGGGGSFGARDTRRGGGRVSAHSSSQAARLSLLNIQTFIPVDEKLLIIDRPNCL